MWKQAIEDNPDPTKFIPVPIVGFNELKYRILCQEKETETHALYLAKVQRDLTELKQKHADSAATILGHKRKLADLSHRILNVCSTHICLNTRPKCNSFFLISLLFFLDNSQTRNYT